MFNRPRPDFDKLVDLPEIEREWMAGHFDGIRSDGPYHGPNRHPAYIHGFLDGRDDLLRGRRQENPHRRTAQQRKEAWAYIEAVFGDAAPQ